MGVLLATAGSAEPFRARFSSLTSLSTAALSVRGASQCHEPPAPPLWGGVGAPGGTVRRAAVRKRGPGAQSRSEHQLPD